MKTVFYESKYQCQITKVCATREFVSLDLWIFNDIHKRKQCHCIQVSSSNMCGINWKHDSLKAHRALLCTITRIHIAFILANNQQPILYCSVVNCPSRTAPANGQMTPSSPGSFQAGLTLIFECNAGYSLEGSESITCLASGLWTSLPPTCTGRVRDFCSVFLKT